MANLVTALQAACAQLSDVVKTTIFVASARQADLGLVWKVIRAVGQGRNVETPTASAAMVVCGKPTVRKAQLPGGNRFAAIRSLADQESLDLEAGLLQDQPSGAVPGHVLARVG